tara:strand:+ start:9 stop:230 length:222 start_codon:yes stop_codon:yes gene_type:complete
MFTYSGRFSAFPYVFKLLSTVCAKNSAGFGTLRFLLTVISIIWFMFHFTFQPALFLAFIVRSYFIKRNFSFIM